MDTVEHFDKYKTVIVEKKTEIVLFNVIKPDGFTSNLLPPSRQLWSIREERKISLRNARDRVRRVAATLHVRTAGRLKTGTRVYVNTRSNVPSGWIPAYGNSTHGRSPTTRARGRPLMKRSRRSMSYAFILFSLDGRAFVALATARRPSLPRAVLRFAPNRRRRTIHYIVIARRFARSRLKSENASWPKQTIHAGFYFSSSNQWNRHKTFCRFVRESPTVENPSIRTLLLLSTASFDRTNSYSSFRCDERAYEYRVRFDFTARRRHGAMNSCV